MFNVRPNGLRVERNANDLDYQSRIKKLLQKSVNSIHIRREKCANTVLSELRSNVRFGSVADLYGDISSMSGIGGIADTRISRIWKIAWPLTAICGHHKSAASLATSFSWSFSRRTSQVPTPCDRQTTTKYQPARSDQRHRMTVLRGVRLPCRSRHTGCPFPC